MTVQEPVANPAAHPTTNASHPGMKKSRCSSCATEMAFPTNAKYVKCPSCASVTDNQPLMQSTCVGCGSALSHPTMAQYIRCPKCLSTMMSSGAVKRQQEQERKEREKKEKAKDDAAKPTKEKEMAYCGTCSSLLSFPVGVKFILCPACKKTMNPQDPQQSSCSACRTVLTHPSHSLYIQCPVCLQTQNAREKRHVPAPAPAPAPAVSAPPDGPSQNLPPISAASSEPIENTGPTDEHKRPLENEEQTKEAAKRLKPDTVEQAANDATECPKKSSSAASVSAEGATGTGVDEYTATAPGAVGEAEGSLSAPAEGAMAGEDSAA